MSRRKGIFLTLDLMAALFFFMVIIITLLWLWGQSQRHMVEYQDSSAKHKRLADISTLLVKSQGNPRDWEHHSVNPDDVNTLGLALTDNVLDPKKLDALSAADYDDLRVIMGFSSEDFRIVVAQNYSGVPVVLYAKGASVTTTGEKLVSNSYALFNNTRVELTLETYYNKK
jgi:hypothetical protein